MPKEPRRFYKTILVFEVLSEEPIPPHVDLEYIATEATEGRYVGRFGDLAGAGEILLNGVAMAAELRDFGSEPSFFELDDDGFDIDESEEEGFWRG